MSYNVNQKCNNFTVTKYLPIDEIKVELIELKHNTLGTEVIKIKNDDDENLFCISLKTWPQDSFGEAHILEHTVLCGSKKFPVKDPFFSMLRRSLNTFMNAMTGSDFTCYPASSLVEKDFYNLFEVYIDAVFHPKLDRLSFLQEGHRFEFLKPDDASSNLIYKGIVYNEMKGSMANPDSILFQKMQENLTPDLPYAFNSGGDPKEIPNLTYENLKKFHETFYHPSRSIFFLYGNLDLEKQLDFIEENALKNAKEKPKLGLIPKQKRFSKKKTIEDRYPISEKQAKEDGAIISFGYLTCPIEDQIDLHGLLLLDSILMGTDGSYLKLNILKSNLCKEVESVFDTEMSEAPYILICRGCKSESKDALFKVIKESLEKLIETKIDPKIIDAALHQLEFSRTEISSGMGPYGLTLFFRSALAKQLGAEPENALVIHTLFKTLREKLKDPNYIPYLIKKYFLENHHMVELILKADSNLTAETEIKERKKLDAIQMTMQPKQIEQILEDTKNLNELQKKLEKTSIECLPKIAIEEVPKKNKNIALHIEEKGKFKIFHHDVFTNDISYVDLIFDLPELSLKELILLPLFSSLVTDVGAGKRNYVENLNFIQAYTGGIQSDLSLNFQADNFDNIIPSISIRSKSLYRNTDKMFSLIKDVIENPMFSDINRIKECLLQQYTFLENSIVQHSMSYATNLSQSSLSTGAFLSSKFDGIDYLNNLRILIKDLDKNAEKLIEELNALKEKVFCVNRANLVISSNGNFYKDLKKNNFYSLLDLEFKNLKPFSKNFQVDKIKSQPIFISSPVAFSASSYRTIGFLHEKSPALLIASKLFSNKILHKKIREEGGAYGSGTNYSPTTGLLTFFGFRDPHITSTLKAFKFAIEEISNGNFLDSDIDEAKLGIIQKTDVPISPGARAITAYSWLKANKTDEMRQEFRNKILSTSKEDIIKAVEENLLNQIDNAITATFCSKELFDKEKPKL
ncbi:MAG: hypothetical protein K1060chlam1_00102 [Candidatus Anoxychlamydiales bacterium]|nr:hypothetical protein [Candidatus Anoxychlamydiales bacterium]